MEGPGTTKSIIGQEGFEGPKRGPTDGSEVLSREGRIEKAQKNVRDMFVGMMGTNEDVVGHLIAEGNPSFGGPEERNF